MKLYLATSNEDKVREISEIFQNKGLIVEVLSTNALGGMPAVEETEDTFSGNARLKAEALMKIVPPNSWVLADDSGLEVDILGGSPGIHSSRYAGEHATYSDNNRKLLEKLRGVPVPKRSARFVCCLVLAGPSGQEHVFRGACEGLIAEKESGENGFGYDPLFIPEGFDQTFGELDPLKKERMSHRAFAIADLVHWIKFHQNALGAGV